MNGATLLQTVGAGLATYLAVRGWHWIGDNR